LLAPRHEIKDAHASGVSVAGFVAGGALVASGGQDGQVRFWERVASHRYKLLTTTKDHKGPVTALAARSGRGECVTTSKDGSVVTWDLETLSRINMLLIQTNLHQVAYV